MHIEYVCAHVFLATIATTFQIFKSAYFMRKGEMLYTDFPEKEQSIFIKETVNQVFYVQITELCCLCKPLSFGWGERTPLKMISSFWCNTE